MERTANRRFVRAASCWLLVAIASLVLAGKAGAEWRKLGDAVVWSDVGVLFEFRVARTSDRGQYHTFVIDCDDRSALPALSGEKGDEVLDGDWFDVEARTIGETITNYACDLKFESTGCWIGSVDPRTSPATILGFDQWSQVGELGDLKLTWIRKHGSHDREVWFVRCSDAALMQVSSVESEKKFLINGRWKIAEEPADRAMVGYACGTCQSLLGFACSPHDL